jgi:hypothetical protein
MWQFETAEGAPLITKNAKEDGHSSVTIKQDCAAQARNDCKLLWANLLMQFSLVCILAMNVL